jgi:guanylate kinase
VGCRPFAVVLAAPSGAGKTSLAKALVLKEPGIEFSISATTRPKRPGERDGHDYYFVDEAEFDRKIAAQELLEWAEVHGKRYGTPRRSVEEPLSRGKLVLLDIDVQGAREVRKAFPDAVLIFVLPPSVEELHRRLTGRGSEASSERRTRLATALVELNAAEEFDYVIVNDDFETALSTLRAILVAERHRLSRFDDLPGRLDVMRDDLANSLKGIS